MSRLTTIIKQPIYNLIDRFTFHQNEHLSFFLEAESWSYERLLDYQLTRIRAICQHWGLSVNTWDDFYRLPLTGKPDMDMYRPPAGKYNTQSTSGSTGEPRTIYIPWETWYRKDALFHRSWMWLGRQPHQPVLRLIAGKPHYAWYDWWRNDKVICRDEVDRQVQYVIEYRPYLIHGPGLPIRRLCEEVIKAGHEDVLKDIRVEWCSTSPEGHRERLEPYLSGFHEQYGLAELPTVGSPCLYNMHVVMETGVVEVVADEVVVTDFNNTITPILRYRTGDEGKIRASDCPCGRAYPILYDVKGRRTDYYDGPEVKQPIGWWLVSPLGHNYPDVISAWKVEIYPRSNKMYLNIVFKEGGNFEALETYQDWVKEKLGLSCVIIKCDDASDWKRDLVRVY